MGLANLAFMPSKPGQDLLGRQGPPGRRYRPFRGLCGGQAGMSPRPDPGIQPRGKASEATQTNRGTQPLYRERLKV